jgi:hypothetical protein
MIRRLSELAPRIIEGLGIVNMISRLALAAYFFTITSVAAHDEWSNGKPVPAWVKASCRGPADAHRLTPDMVRRISDSSYQVDGYSEPIPVAKALPSQDGDYWIFYASEHKECAIEAPLKCWQAPQSGVYCFFVPMEF